MKADSSYACPAEVREQQGQKAPYRVRPAADPHTEERPLDAKKKKERRGSEVFALPSCGITLCWKQASEQVGLLHDAQEFFLVHFSIPVPISLVDHFLKLPM